MLKAPMIISTSETVFILPENVYIIFCIYFLLNYFISKDPLLAAQRNERHSIALLQLIAKHEIP